MSTLREQPINEDSTVAEPTQMDTLTKIKTLLQNFTVLPKIEHRFFMYGIIAFFALYMIDAFQIALSLPHLRPHKDIAYDITFTKNLLLIVIGTSLIAITFNFWRQYIQMTLKYIFNNSRIFALSEDANEDHLSMFEAYQHNLKRRRKYILIVSLLILTAIYYFGYVLVPAIRDTLVYHMNDVIFVFSYSGHLLIVFFVLFSSMYCIGVVWWTTYASGKYIRRLIKSCEFNIEPLHPDKCGGLKILGNFCFGLISPVFVGSVYFVGYIFVALKAVTGVYDPITVLFIVAIILLYALPISIYAFLIPLSNIHSKMLHSGEIEDKNYADNMESSRQMLQKLLDDGKVEEAKEIKGKMDFMETTYIRYPRWPLNVATKILTTSLTTITSFGLGLLTALQGPLSKIILQLMGVKS
jgi:hypothetical protein